MRGLACCCVAVYWIGVCSGGRGLHSGAEVSLLRIFVRFRLEIRRARRCLVLRWIS